MVQIHLTISYLVSSEVQTCDIGKAFDWISQLDDSFVCEVIPRCIQPFQGCQVVQVPTEMDETWKQ